MLRPFSGPQPVKRVLCIFQDPNFDAKRITEQIKALEHYAKIDNAMANEKLETMGA